MPLVLRCCIFLQLFSCWKTGLLCAQQLAPPNAPAIIDFAHGQLIIRYEGRVILSANTDEKRIQFNSQVYKKGEEIDQVVVLESPQGGQFALGGMIYGTEESFACESDYPVKTPAILRFSVGLSHSLLNRAVYDRQRDCLISFDLPNPVLIIPEKETQSQHTFQFSVRSEKLVIRFRPRFYQQHKGLSYFEPWTYSVWDRSVAGWSSWYAYFNSVTEKNIHEVADSLSKSLLPFGYHYVQIDDGYQQEPTGRPEHWLSPNQKFPAGLDSLSRYISKKGLTPAIWTNVSCADSLFAFTNPEWFVKNRENLPASGEWIGYIMDGSSRAAMERLVYPVYSGLYKMGWRYFKLDALRHLKYEGYNSYADYFSRKNVNRTDAFRTVVQTVRAAIGRESYLLGCWGIRPELAGLIDGCRIGNDGFGYAGLGQFNSLNNIVWRNDPDHVELTDAEAFRSCTVTSLTGSVLLLTDKPDRYKGKILEAARRTAPVLFALPGQVYEVDPSRIQSIRNNDREVSGDGQRLFDAGYTPLVELYALEINRPFENWLLLGRMNGKNRQVSMQDLGLEQETDYEVFEFWTKTYLGTTRRLFDFPDIDTGYHCQVFCFRKKLDRPQLLATSRHISCGGPDLKNCSWDSATNRLSGRSENLAAEDYTLYIRTPAAYKFSQAKAGGRTARITKRGDCFEVCFSNETAADMDWEIEFVKGN